MLNELQALKELRNQVRRWRMTPPVDDDYPQVQFEFLRAHDIAVEAEICGAIPVIVCLCGSTKFKGEFIRKNYEFTMKGYIVLSVGWFSHADSSTFYPTSGEKRDLDALHKRKIDLCDEIYVINPNGYIGDSTKSEIDYAKTISRTINYMEEPTDG